jgi:hypothetical protein
VKATPFIGPIPIHIVAGDTRSVIEASRGAIWSGLCMYMDVGVNPSIVRGYRGFKALMMDHVVPRVLQLNPLRNGARD